MMGLSKKHLIYGAVTFVSLLGALLKLIVDPSPAWTFYLGVMYATFLFWAVGQLREISAQEDARRTDNIESRLPHDSLPPDRRPSQEILNAAEAYVAIGESLDVVCLALEPRYRDWSNSEKLAFRQSLKAAIDQRKAQTAEAGGA
jgi:hypothetical protein